MLWAHVPWISMSANKHQSRPTQKAKLCPGPLPNLSQITLSVSNTSPALTLSTCLHAAFCPRADISYSSGSSSMPVGAHVHVPLLCRPVRACRACVRACRGSPTSCPSRCSSRKKSENFHGFALAGLATSIVYHMHMAVHVDMSKSRHVVIAQLAAIEPTTKCEGGRQVLRVRAGDVFETERVI